MLQQAVGDNLSPTLFLLAALAAVPEEAEDGQDEGGDQAQLADARA